MGSPVSVVVAEIVMQRLAEKALATYPDPPSFRYRYVDDTLTSLKKSEKIDFLNHLNRLNPSIQFTMELEKDGTIAFLDCLITRSDNSVQTSAYRKPTSTDRLLDNSSYHPASHKSSTIKTLVKRAHMICSSSDNLESELKHLNDVFDVNNYPKPFVKSVIEQAMASEITTKSNILLNCFASELSVEQVEYIFYRTDVGASWKNAVHFYFHFFSSSRGVL